MEKLNLLHKSLLIRSFLILCIALLTINKSVAQFGVGKALDLMESAKETKELNENKTVGPKLILPTGHAGKINSVAFSHDGQYVVTGSADKTVKLWHTKTGYLIRSFIGHEHAVQGVGMSPDGKYIYSVSSRSHGPKAKLIVWDAVTGKVVWAFLDDNFDNSKSLSVSPDGKYVLVGAMSAKNKGMMLWNPKLAKLSKTFKVTYQNNKIQLPYSVGFSKDGLHAISLTVKVSSTGFNNVVEIWKVANAKLVNTFNYATKQAMKSATFSDDGRFIILQNHDNSFTTADRFSGNAVNSSVIPIFENASLTNKFAFDFQNNLAVASNTNNTIVLYNLKTGDVINEFMGGAMQKLSVVKFMGNNKYIATRNLKGYKVWNLASGRPVRNPEAHVNTKDIPSYDSKDYQKFNMVELPGKQQAISVHMIDNGPMKYLALWDTKRGLRADKRKLIHLFEGHNAFIPTFDVSADGKFVLSGSDDGTTRLWDIESGKELCKIIILPTKGAEISNDWVIVSIDGRFDASPGALEKMHYVDNMEVFPLSAFHEKFYTPHLLARIMGNENFETEIEMEKVLAPPLVEIISPDNNSKTNSKEIQLKINVTDQGGGFNELRLYQNGKLVETAQRGFKKVSSDNIENYTLTLSSGANTIKAVAYSDQRIESVPDVIEVYYEGQKKESNLHLFVVGIDTYKNPKYNLNYALSDAKAFKQAMVKNSESIFKSAQITIIENQEATRNNIIAAFNSIKPKISQDDVFVFYYAGHGVMSEEEKPQFYIVPTDITQLYGNSQQLKEKGLSAVEMQQFSLDIKAQKQLFIMDACQSGGMTEMLAMRGAAEEKAIAQLARSTGTYWLTASGSEQFATEFAELGHGLFTYTIIQGLNGAADGAKDGKVTVKELSAFIEDQVPELSEKHKGQSQYPNTYGFGQDFPIVIVK